nr:hypothetical protein [uncultured Sphaerochaeta sp.]
MKGNRILLAPVSLVLLVLMISCSPMESQLFQNLKETNTFKSFEEIPFYTNAEMMAHINPYATISNGKITSFHGDPNAFELVVEETDSNTDDPSFPVGTSDIRIKEDMFAYIDKLNEMISRNTLVEFVVEGQGNLGNTTHNLTKIKDALTGKLSIANQVGYVNATTKSQVEEKIYGIAEDIDELINAIEEGGM